MWEEEQEELHPDERVHLDQDSLSMPEPPLKVFQKDFRQDSATEGWQIGLLVFVDLGKYSEYYLSEEENQED